jgi:hypothetical protein
VKIKAEARDTSLDSVNMWLRINNPEIQATYRNYQREKVRDDYKLLLATFLLFWGISLGFYIYLKIKVPKNTSEAGLKLHSQW